MRYAVTVVPKLQQFIIHAENEKEAEAKGMENYQLEFEEVIISKLP